MLLLFIDGVGVGRFDSKTNPCALPGLSYFNRFQDRLSPPLPYSGVWRPIDAALGVAGLPQSATGQTALMSGENASARVGRHINGLPTSALRKILASKNLFKELRSQNKLVTFFNAYRPEWFIIDETMKRRYASVTTVSNQAAGLPFYSIDDVRCRRSIYQEFTNQHLVRRNYIAPLATPEEAARALCANMDKFDFVMFEYFQTDKIAHAQSMLLAHGELFKLERFLSTLLKQLDLQLSNVVLVSDHGNLEDISTRSHTRNRALFMAWGRDAQNICKRTQAISDVYRSIIETPL